MQQLEYANIWALRRIDNIPKANSGHAKLGVTYYWSKDYIVYIKYKIWQKIVLLYTLIQAFYLIYNVLDI